MMWNLASVVCRWFRCRTLGGDVALRHAAINHEVGAVDEAALVARKEDNGLRLLDGLAKSACWEVYLAAVTLRCVVTKPVLQERGAEYVST